MFPLHCELFLSLLPKPFHGDGHGEDDEDGDGQDDVYKQKDGMEKLQMTMKANDAIDVPGTFSPTRMIEFVS